MATPIQVDESSFKSLAGKTLLITGASSGIGLETAEYFYELGCNVVFVGGRKRPPTEIPLENNPRTLLCNCDIRSWDAQVDVFEAAVAKFGPLDFVCPNAGVDDPRDQYLELKLDERGRPQPLDMRALDVDLRGTAQTMALGIHYLNPKGGCIVIMSSLAGYAGVPDMPNYTASKHAATGFLRSLTAPLRRKNIALSLVAPHVTFTPGTFPDTYKRGEEAYEQTRQELLKVGLRLSSSRTCALAVAHLVVAGLSMAGEALLIENDEINTLETELHKARPDWFLKKTVNEEVSQTFSDIEIGVMPDERKPKA